MPQSLSVLAHRTFCCSNLLKLTNWAEVPLARQIQNPEGTSSPHSISSNSSPPSLGTSVSLLPHSTAARAALGAKPCALVGAPGWRGDATPDWDQAHVVASSTVSNAPLAAPRDVDLPSDDASEAFDVSVATANSKQL